MRDDPELERYISPTKNPGWRCLPNFFVEIKGPKGRNVVLQRQALHDGAIGARGIHALRSSIEEPTVLDGKAYTIVTTYSDGPKRDVLTIYAIHPV